MPAAAGAVAAYIRVVGLETDAPAGAVAGDVAITLFEKALFNSDT
jgi:hypothetical protein